MIQKEKKNLKHTIILGETKNLIRSVTSVQDDVLGQSGRSMVEMLGVLAVMGVLSVGGVAMYTTAMNKHRANELLNEASKRAVIAHAQLAQGRTVNLSEFTNNDLGYGTFTTDVISGTGSAFGIKVSGVSEGVCKQLANMSSGRVQVKKQGALSSTFSAANCASSADSNALAFVFGEGELTEDESGTDVSSSLDAGSGSSFDSGSNSGSNSGSDFDSGSGSDSWSVECTVGSTAGLGGPTGQYDGKNACKCPNANEVYTNNGCEDISTNCPSGLTKDGNGKCLCNSYTTNQCGTGYFCLFSSPTDCYDNGQGTGICTEISGDYAGYQNDSNHWYGKYTLNWYSANSWCIGKGRPGLLTCDGTGTGYSCTWENVAAKVAGSDVPGKIFWLKNLDGNASCFAWGTNLSLMIVGQDNRTESFSAVCE